MKRFELNAGSGMALGAAGGALTALIVNLITGDGAIWAWAIPVGLAAGLAIGSGKKARRKEKAPSE